MTAPAQRVAQSLGRLLLRDTRSGLYRELVADVDGLDPTTYPVLSGLERTGTTTSSELAGAVGLDRSVVSRHLTTLQAHGLVERRAHDRDARATTVALTDAGRDAVGRTRMRLDELLGEFLAGYPDGQAESFAEMLTALVERLRAA